LLNRLNPEEIGLVDDEQTFLENFEEIHEVANEGSRFDVGVFCLRGLRVEKPYLLYSLLYFILYYLVLALQIVHDKLLVNTHVFPELSLLLLPKMSMHHRLLDWPHAGLHALHKDAGVNFLNDFQASVEEIV
jgi:hypothetical protein